MCQFVKKTISHRIIDGDEQKAKGIKLNFTVVTEGDFFVSTHK